MLQYQKNQEIQGSKCKYRVVQKIGQGAISEVYLGLNLISSEYVAIKAMNRIRIQDNQPNIYYDSEIQIATRLSTLNCDYIANVLEVLPVENNSSCLIISEFCDNGDLESNLQALKNNRMIISDNQKLCYCISICEGVSFLHYNSIVHRDLKPDNILIKQQNDLCLLKITDFGLCKQNQDVYNSFVGTILYMAPEILKNEEYTQKVDVWSLGCIMDEIVRGEVLFNGNSFQGIMNSIKGFQKYTENHFMSDIISRCLTPDPNLRMDIIQLLNSLYLLYDQMNPAIPEPPQKENLNKQEYLNTQQKSRPTISRLNEQIQISLKSQLDGRSMIYGLNGNKSNVNQIQNTQIVQGNNNSLELQQQQQKQQQNQIHGNKNTNSIQSNINQQNGYYVQNNQYSSNQNNQSFNQISNQQSSHSPQPPQVQNYQPINQNYQQNQLHQQSNQNQFSNNSNNNNKTENHHQEIKILEGSLINLHLNEEKKVDENQNTRAPQLGGQDIHYDQNKQNNTQNLGQIQQERKETINQSERINSGQIDSTKIFYPNNNHISNQQQNQTENSITVYPSTTQYLSCISSNDQFPTTIVDEQWKNNNGSSQKDPEIDLVGYQQYRQTNEYQLSQILSDNQVNQNSPIPSQNFQSNVKQGNHFQQNGFYSQQQHPQSYQNTYQQGIFPSNNQCQNYQFDYQTNLQNIQNNNQQLSNNPNRQLQSKFSTIQVNNFNYQKENTISQLQQQQQQICYQCSNNHVIINVQQQNNNNNNNSCSNHNQMPFHYQQYQQQQYQQQYQQFQNWQPINNNENKANYQVTQSQQHQNNSNGYYTNYQNGQEFNQQAKKNLLLVSNMNYHQDSTDSCRQNSFPSNGDQNNFTNKNLNGTQQNSCSFPPNTQNYGQQNKDQNQQAVDIFNQSTQYSQNNQNQNDKPELKGYFYNQAEQSQLQQQQGQQQQGQQNEQQAYNNTIRVSDNQKNQNYNQILVQNQENIQDNRQVQNIQDGKQLIQSEKPESISNSQSTEDLDRRKQEPKQNNNNQINNIPNDFFRDEEQNQQKNDNQDNLEESKVSQIIKQIEGMKEYESNIYQPEQYNPHPHNQLDNSSLKENYSYLKDYPQNQVKMSNKEYSLSESIIKQVQLIEQQFKDENEFKISPKINRNRGEYGYGILKEHFKTKAGFLYFETQYEQSFYINFVKYLIWLSFILEFKRSGNTFGLIANMLVIIDNNKLKIFERLEHITKNEADYQDVVKNIDHFIKFLIILHQNDEVLFKFYLYIEVMKAQQFFNETFIKIGEVLFENLSELNDNAQIIHLDSLEDSEFLNSVEQQPALHYIFVHKLDKNYQVCFTKEQFQAFKELRMKAGYKKYKIL